MSWDAYAEELEGTTTAAAIISDEGALCGKHKEFNATPQECVQWSKCFKDPPLARQKGISYNGKKYFATEFDEHCIVARRDNFYIVLMKSISIIVCGIADDPASPSEVKEDVKRVVDMLNESGY